MATQPQGQDKGASPSSSALSAYSDASSSYWPPGWNFARFARATSEDVLSDDERAKMQAGFRDVLGEDGVSEMARVVWQEQLRLKRLEKATGSSQTRKQTPPPPPNWLTEWRKRPRGQPWGFIAFYKPTATSTEGAGLEQFQALTREIAEIPFDRALEQGQPTDEIAEARKAFQLRWVEVTNDDAVREQEEQKAEGAGHDRLKAATDSLEELLAQYQTVQETGDLPSDFFLPLFLYASPGAVESVLSTSSSLDKNPEAKPQTTGTYWRSDAPYLLAIPTVNDCGVVEDSEDSNSGYTETDWFKPIFKVAIEVLVEELWWVLESQMTPVWKLTRTVRQANLTDGELAKEEKESTGDKRPSQSGDNADGHDLDDMWWTLHISPHRLRKRRRMFASE